MPPLAILENWRQGASGPLAERERWPLWLPVFLGAGIAGYFAWPSEPPPWVGASALAALIALWAVVRRRALASLLVLPVLMAALGLAAVQTRAWLVAAPVLERPSGKVTLDGRVAEVEPLAEGGQRVTLEEVAMALDGPVPQRLRLRLRQSEPVPVGARIRLRAMLVPPPQPQAPGAFDFARQAWFQGLGAVGSGYGRAEILAPADGQRWLNRWRHQIGLRVTAVLPGALGGVASALITGETAAIPRSLLDDYRDSGLAHLLSISGLHMSLLAGMVFFVVRGGLALVPALALRWPIKKWAAAVALLLTFSYMLLAGAPVPAQRSFLMSGIVLLAVMVDRAALSMRLVAWSAVAVLLLAPEALVGPSFQMSFAAVAALIATYEVAAAPMAAWRAGHPRPHHRLGYYLAGVVLSTLVAGSSTALYGAYHFNRFAVWSVLANMAAVPLTGIMVMPFAMAGLMLMPLGLEAVALVPMGWGVAAVNWVAAQVAALPGAAVTLPVLPAWGLVIFTLGGLWLLIWRRRWRLWGLLPMAAGLAGFALSQPPDLLVDSRGYSFGVRLADGSLLVNRGGRMLRETWERRAGPAAGQRWPRRGRSVDGRLACDAKGCLYRRDATAVALVQDEGGIAAACAEAQVVIGAVPLRRSCRGPRLVIDRFDLWRRGAHAVWLDSGRVDSVAAWQGERPWAHHPVRRRPPPPASGADGSAKIGE